nr:hypothetical protein [uncultured Flavobacterium sp.]
MERIITTRRAGTDPAAISYEKAIHDVDKNDVVTEEASCALQLKNLIKTNLKLLNLNDIRSIIFF